MLRDDLVKACVDIIPGVNRSMQVTYVRALMDLCDKADPVKVVDIGTNYGVSCLALASALRTQHKSMNDIATIDIHRGMWLQTRDKMADRFDKMGVFMTRINAIEKDFKQVPAAEMIDRGHMMIFFDIHDHEDKSGVANSLVFIRDWLPMINNAIVAVHDITPCEEDWERPAEWGIPPSFAKVQSINGQWFRGFGETKAFIEYLDDHNVGPFTIPDTSIIWFRMKDGVPQ